MSAFLSTCTQLNLQENKLDKIQLGSRKLFRR